MAKITWRKRKSAWCGLMGPLCSRREQSEQPGVTMGISESSRLFWPHHGCCICGLRVIQKTVQLALAENDMSTFVAVWGTGSVWLMSDLLNNHVLAGLSRYRVFYPGFPQLAASRDRSWSRVGMRVMVVAQAVEK